MDNFKMASVDTTISSFAHGPTEDGEGNGQIPQVTPPSSALIQSLVAPISGSNLMGDDPRYTAEFEFVKTEIEKTSGMDLQNLQEYCHTILTSKAKDIRVFGFYCFAALREGHVVKVCEIVQAFCHVASENTSAINPLRDTAKRNAFAWINHEKLSRLMETVKVEANMHDAIAMTCEALIKLKCTLDVNYPDLPPSIGRFLKSFQKWNKMSAQLQNQTSKPNSIPQPTQPSDTASPEAVVQKPLSTEVINHKTGDKTGAQNMLQQVADYFQSEHPQIAMGYQTMRMLKWSEIQKAPAVEGGLIKIQGPSDAQQKSLEQLCSHENWAELLKKSEEMFTYPGMHFWFDLQYYSCLALEGLGYQDCAKVIKRELQSLLDKASELTTFRFQGGVPFASEMVKQWVQELSSEGKVTIPTVPVESQKFITDEENEKVKKFLQQNKLSEALALVETSVQGLKPREYAERRLFMAEICHQNKKYLSAEGLLENLRQEFGGEVLRKWDSAFSGKLYYLSKLNAEKMADATSTHAQEKLAYHLAAQGYAKYLSALDPIKYSGIL